MRLKEYGRNAKTRKVYIQQPGLLIVGVDASKAKKSTLSPVSSSRMLGAAGKPGLTDMPTHLKSHSDPGFGPRFCCGKRGLILSARVRRREHFVMRVSTFSQSV